MHHKPRYTFIYWTFTGNLNLEQSSHWNELEVNFIRNKCMQHHKTMHGNIYSGIVLNISFNEWVIHNVLNIQSEILMLVF